MQDVQEIKITSIKQCAAVAGAALIVMILAWSSASMQLGNLLAETTSSLEPHSHDIARLALRLAPGDPHARHLIALTANNPDVTVEELENTVKSSPSDFRWRVALGRSYEQTGQVAKAERQFQAAVDLAPKYAFSQWNLGNFYLRQGREAEAVEHLRQATVGHYTFRGQVFSLAWDYFDGDTEQVARAASDDAETRAYLSHFFAQRGKGSAAIKIWNQLRDDDKEKFRAVGSLVLQELYGKGNYPEALEMARQLGDTTAVPETVANASFEEPLIEGPKARFGWEIVPGDTRAEISVDNQNRHSGARSLKLLFRGIAKSEFVNAFQAIVVRPETNYSLSFYFRTDALRSPVRPILQVVSAHDNRILVSSEMFPPDSADWRQTTVSFRTAANTTGISIRTFRPMCGEQCSITGALWYDDFELSEAIGR